LIEFDWLYFFGYVIIQRWSFLVQWFKFAVSLLFHANCIETVDCRLRPVERHLGGLRRDARRLFALSHFVVDDLLLNCELVLLLPLDESQLIGPEVLNIALLTLLAALAGVDFRRECATLDLSDLFLLTKPLDLVLLLHVWDGLSVVHVAVLGSRENAKLLRFFVGYEVVFAGLVLMERHCDHSGLEVFDFFEVMRSLLGHNSFWDRHGLVHLDVLCLFGGTGSRASAQRIVADVNRVLLFVDTHALVDGPGFTGVVHRFVK
jgi:hypothetical protein